MAYANVSTGTVNTTASSPNTPAFGATTGAGHLLVAWIQADGSGVATSASGWVTADTAANVAIFYKPNSSSGETAPTFTSSGASQMNAVLAEFSGGATSSPVDQFNSTASSPTTNASADSAAGELMCFAQWDLLSKAGTDTTTISYNNGGSATSVGNNDASSVAIHFRFSWAITTGNSSADSATFTSSSMNLTNTVGRLVSFKLPPVVTGTPNVNTAPYLAY